MNFPRFTKCFGLSGLLLLSTMHSVAVAVAAAEQPSEETFNPVENASFHHLVFADEDIAILDNYYPPNADSGFHAHYRDLFAVVIQSSPSTGQALGKPLKESPVYPVGAAAYSAVGDEPRRVHRVINGDKGISHYIVVELRRENPSGKPVSSRDGAPEYVQLVDNPKMRAWRLILEPGQSASKITQGNKGVRVVVRGGVLTTIIPGLTDQQLALRPGDFAVQAAGTTRALKNIGTGTIELVEMELK